MSADHQAGQGAVRGPEGMPITLDDLPPPGTKRWVIRRKAEVVEFSTRKLDDAYVKADAKRIVRLIDQELLAHAGLTQRSKGKR